MKAFDKAFSREEEEALAILQARGFKAFTEAKLEDVRELETGRRRRTFRNQGRYDLVLALRDVEAPAPSPEKQAKSLDDMTVKELREEAKDIPGGPKITHRMTKPTLFEIIKKERERRKVLLKKF